MLRLIKEYGRRWGGFAPQLRQLYLFSALQQVGLGASSLILILRLEQLGWTELELARLAAIGLAAGCVVALPAGLAVRRGGPRQAVIIASLGLSVTAALKAIIASHLALTALSVVDGACLAVLYTAYSPLLFEITAPHERSFAYSLDFFLVSLCTPVGSALAGLVAQLTQHGRPFASAAGLSLIAAAAAVILAFATLPLLIVAPSPASDEPCDTPTAPQPRQKRLWLVAGLPLLSALLFTSAVAHLQPLSVVYLGDSLCLSAAGIGMVNGLVAILSSVLVLLTPMLIARLGLRDTLLVTQAGAALMLAAMALLSRAVGALPAYLLWASAVQSAGPLRERLVLEAWPSEDKSLASGCLYTLQNGGGALGALAGGALTTRGGFAVSLICAAALGALSSLVLTQLPRLRTRALASAPASVAPTGGNITRIKNLVAYRTIGGVGDVVGTEPSMASKY